MFREFFFSIEINYTLRYVKTKIYIFAFLIWHKLSDFISVLIKNISFVVFNFKFFNYWIQYVSVIILCKKYFFILLLLISASSSSHGTILSSIFIGQLQFQDWKRTRGNSQSDSLASIRSPIVLYFGNVLLRFRPRTLQGIKIELSEKAPLSIVETPEKIYSRNGGCIWIIDRATILFYFIYVLIYKCTDSMTK